LKKAIEQENKGDLFLCKAMYLKASKKYKKAIEFAKD